MSVLNHFGDSDTSRNNSHLTQAGKTGGLVAGTVVAMLAMSSVQAEGPTSGTSVDGGDIATSQFNLTPAELEKINQDPFAETGYGGLTIAPINKIISPTRVNNTNNIASGSIPSNQVQNLQPASVLNYTKGETEINGTYLRGDVEYNSTI